MSEITVIDPSAVEVLDLDEAGRSSFKDEDGLTVKQRSFCDALIANSGNRTKAAITAGYSPRSAHVAGSRLMKLVQVRKYLALQAEAIMAEAAPMAAQAMKKLLKHKSGYVRVEAAKDVLNRTGVGQSTNGAGARPLNVIIKL